MKFNPAFERNNRSKFHPALATALAASVLCMAVTRTAGVQAPDNDEELPTGGGGDSDEDVTSQGGETSTGTGTGTGVTSQTDAKGKTAVNNKTVEEAVSDTGLLNLVKAYDDVKEKVNSYMCDMAEYIAKENLGRPVVIKTLMEARGVTLETAASSASRLIKLAKDPESIKGLRDGTLTVRETLYGRPKPGTTTDAGAGGGEGGGQQQTAGGGKKNDIEKKEEKYNRLLKEFVDHAKSCGFSLDEILKGVRASLKDVGVK